MKIAIVWKEDYPWDVRIEKIAKALKEAGHDTYILCSNNKGLDKEEVQDSIKIIRFSFTRNKKLNLLMSLPFYFNPFWLRMISKVVKKEKIDLIIVRDLPLSIICLFIKRKYKIPIVLDVAENYPAMYWDLFRWDLLHKGGMIALKDWFIKNPFLAKMIEKYVVKRVDYLFVVVEESANRLIAMGFNDIKLSIISNTPDLNKFKGIDFFIKGKYVNGQGVKEESYIKMIYVGLIQDRGLDIIVRSLVNLRSMGVLSKFLVIGDGYYLNELKDLVRKSQVEDIVEFKGWVENRLVPSFINSGDIGVIPHKKTYFTDTTIPNKIFDFMACGKPVIVSDAQPLKRIAEEEKCGLVFESGNIESFIRTFRQMISDRSKMEEMGRNGFEAVHKKYNWENDSLILKQAIENMKVSMAKR